MVDLTREHQLNTAIELMHFAYRTMIAGADRVLAARKLGRVHHRILYFVARLPSPGIRQLLRTLGVSKQALNTPLRDLCGQGLVEIRRSDRDARVKHVYLTAAGKQLEAKLSQLQRRQFARAFNLVGARAEQAWRNVTHELALPELAKSERVLPKPVAMPNTKRLETAIKHVARPKRHSSHAAPKTFTHKART